MSNLLILNLIEWTSRRHQNSALDVELTKGYDFLSKKNGDGLFIWGNNNWTLPIGPLKVSKNHDT